MKTFAFYRDQSVNLKRNTLKIFSVESVALFHSKFPNFVALMPGIRTKNNCGTCEKFSVPSSLLRGILDSERPFFNEGQYFATLDFPILPCEPEQFFGDCEA